MKDEMTQVGKSRLRVIVEPTRNEFLVFASDDHYTSPVAHALVVRSVASIVGEMASLAVVLVYLPST
jgi:hypothetical protein